MSTRAVIRLVNWLISPDRSEGAPAVPLHQMECTTCPERSEASENVADVQNWALGHSGKHPSHTGYREVIVRFWRTSMTD